MTYICIFETVNSFSALLFQISSNCEFNFPKHHGFDHQIQAPNIVFYPHIENYRLKQFVSKISREAKSLLCNQTMPCLVSFPSTLIRGQLSQKHHLATHIFIYFVSKFVFGALSHLTDHLSLALIQIPQRP